MALASRVAWYQSPHCIVCLLGSSLLSFMGTDLGSMWLCSQAHKMLECREGVGGLFAAAACSRVLGTDFVSLFPTLRSELVLGFGFCRAWCVCSTSCWVSGTGVFGFAWIWRNRGIITAFTSQGMFCCFAIGLLKNHFYSVSRVTMLFVQSLHSLWGVDSLCCEGPCRGGWGRSVPAIVESWVSFLGRLCRAGWGVGDETPAVGSQPVLPPTGRDCLHTGWSVTASQGSGFDKLLNTSFVLLKKGLYAGLFRSNSKVAQTRVGAQVLAVFLGSNSTKPSWVFFCPG